MTEIWLHYLSVNQKFDHKRFKLVSILKGGFMNLEHMNCRGSYGMEENMLARKEIRCTIIGHQVAVLPEEYSTIAFYFYL